MLYSKTINDLNNSDDLKVFTTRSSGKIGVAIVSSKTSPTASLEESLVKNIKKLTTKREQLADERDAAISAKNKRQNGFWGWFLGGLLIEDELTDLKTRIELLNTCVKSIIQDIKKQGELLSDLRRSY